MLFNSLAFRCRSCFFCLFNLAVKVLNCTFIVICWGLITKNCDEFLVFSMPEFSFMSQVVFLMPLNCQSVSSCWVWNSLKTLFWLACWTICWFSLLQGLLLVSFYGDYITLLFCAFCTPTICFVHWMSQLFLPMLQSGLVVRDFLVMSWGVAESAVSTLLWWAL